MPVVAMEMTGGRLPPAGWDLAMTVVLTLAGLAALYAASARVRGTTLTAAWLWAGLTLVCLAAAEIAAAWLGERVAPATVQAWRFAAAATTFCPSMAVFGAKRPQHLAWQFVVLSLWCVLVLPAGEALLYGRGLEVDVVRSWFLLILVGMALANMLPTRFALSGILLACGQLLLLGRFLPLLAIDWGPAAPLWGMALAITGGVLFALDWPRGRTARTPIDRVWRDFRDLYGAAWALRVAQRVNETAKTYDWGATLTWQGFVDRPSDVSPDGRAAIESSLTTLLRRFVSAEWITKRLGSGGSIPAE